MSQLPTELKLLVAAGFALIFVHTTPDPDLFGHLVFAADAARGGLPATDPYSFTAAGTRWINHEWLSEWVFYRVWLLGDEVGLQLLKMGLLACAFFVVMARASRVRASSTLTVAMLLTALPTIGMYRQGVRAGLFTLALLAIVCLILTEARQRPRLLWGLPAIFLVWINLHGGVVAGLAIAVVWTAVAVLRPSASQRLTPRTAFWPMLATVGALLVNPYGYELPSFLVWASTMPRPLVTEWAPLHTSPVPLFAFAVPVLLCAAGWLWSPLERNLASLVVCLAVAAQALLHQRHASLAVLVILIFSLQHVDAAARPVLDRLRASRLPGRGAPVAPWARFGVLGLAVLLWPLTFMHLGCWNTTEEFPIPTGAANFLRDSGFRGKLVTPFNWGEFLINRLSPAVRVSMDGRYETAYPPGLAERQYRFMQAAEDWRSYLDDYQPDAILVAVWAPVGDQLAEDSAWTEVYRDELVLIFSHPDRAGDFSQGQRSTPEDAFVLFGEYEPCFAEPLMLELRHDPAPKVPAMQPH